MAEYLHSRSGVLSFIFAVIAAVMTLGLAVVLTFEVTNIAIGVFGGLWLLDGALSAGIGIFTLLSIGLGIWCILKTARQRTYGILGLVVSLASILVTGGLVAWVTLG